MAKSQQTFSKNEKEKKRKKKQEEKERKKEERKANSTGGDFESMLAYVDENGNITSTPPDPLKKKKEIKAENIELGVPKRESLEAADTLRTGKISFFNESKGFGFIKDMNSDESIFVHINSVQGTPKENDKVTFQVEQGPKGLSAVDVKIV